MGCNQSQHKNDSDTDSCSDEVSPYERTPFNSNLSSHPSSTSYIPSRPSSNLNNINNNLHKINITKNGTLSPKASKKGNIKFPNLTSSLSTSPKSNNNEKEKDIPSTICCNKYPQNPVPDKLRINDRLRTITADNHHNNDRAHSFKYRTKKVTIYKPKLQTPSIQKTHDIDHIDDDYKYHSHGRQKSKDDMTLHFNLNRRRSTKPRRNKIDSRLPTIKDSETRSFGIGIGIHRKHDIYSYHMAPQYDTECVTDIDDDSLTDDNHTIIHHDSSNNYDSDDSYWDAMYLQNKKRHTDRAKAGNKSRKNTHSYLTHRRQGTYHAYGGDDDENDSKISDSESGIGINYMEDTIDGDDELSDDSLNRMTKIATGYNEDHPLANSSDDTSDDDDDEQHGIEHHDTPTMLVHDIDSDTITKPLYSSQLSASITGNSDTDTLPGTDMVRTTSSSSIISKSVISCIDKSSISIHQIDKAAFLQKILRNSINKQKLQKQHNEKERIKKQKELKLQETHKTSNIKVIDDNTIAINIGISKSIYNKDTPSIIPEGDEENIINSDDEHYENPSEHDTDTDTDTDPETAMLDFQTPITEKHDDDDDDEMFNLIINKDLENMDRNIQDFKIIVDGLALYNDINLIEEIFTVQFKNGDIVKGQYIDSKIILLTKWKVYVSSIDIMEVKEKKNNDIYIPPPPKPIQTKNRIIVEPNNDKLKEIINKINSTDIGTPIITEILHTEDATMIINQEVIEEISLNQQEFTSSNPVSPESIISPIVSPIISPIISPRTETDEIKSIQNTTELIEVQPLKSYSETESTQNTPEPQTEPEPESETEPESTESIQKKPEKKPEAKPIENSPPKSKINAIGSKVADLNINPAALKPGGIAQTSGDIDDTPKFEPITIDKGRRKKRSKRKRVNVSSPKTDNIAHSLFFNRNEEELPSEQPVLSSEESLVERYRDQLLQNKDEILKLIQTHKENKKNRPKSPTFGENKKNISLDSQLIEACSHDISKLINSGKSNKSNKSNKKTENVAFRPRAESAVKPPKKLNKKKLKPKPIQTRPIYFDKTRQDILSKRKKGKYKPRTARSSANMIKKKNILKTENKMIKSHSASPKQRKKVKEEETARKAIKAIPRTPEILYESKSASPISPEQVTNNGNVIKPRISLKDRMAIYQETSSGIGITAQKRLNKIKADRRTSDSYNISLNEEQRETATALLKEYATKKAAHIADITLIDKTIKDITKNNCIEKLEILGIITYIYVPINEFDRWNNRNSIGNIIDSGHHNIDKYRKYPKQYIKMANITLLNSKILIKLAEEQKELFKTLILFGIERCKLIYKINFNAANITNPFLDKILNIMSLRNDIMNKQQISLYDKDMMYGPELFFVENNPISDRGIEMVCKYIKLNGLHLKCLKVGHCFGTISTNLCGIFCQCLLDNQYILKVTFDMRWSQHRQSVDKALKRNYTKYRNQQKLYKQSLITQNTTKSN